MIDNELVELVARIWVSNGGDEDGLEFCWNKLKEKVKELREGEKNEGFG